MNELTFVTPAINHLNVTVLNNRFLDNVERIRWEMGYVSGVRFVNGQNLTVKSLSLKNDFPLILDDLIYQEEAFKNDEGPYIIVPEPGNARVFDADDLSVLTEIEATLLFNEVFMNLETIKIEWNTEYKVQVIRATGQHELAERLRPFGKLAELSQLVTGLFSQKSNPEMFPGFQSMASLTTRPYIPLPINVIVIDTSLSRDVVNNLVQTMFKGYYLPVPDNDIRCNLAQKSSPHAYDFPKLTTYTNAKYA